MSKRVIKRIAIITVALGIISLTAGWLFGWFSENPAVAEVREMQTKLADSNLKPEDRRALFEAMRAKMDGLSEAARQQLWENNRQTMEKRMKQHVDELHAMSPKDRDKALDADIDRMQKRQQAAQNNPNANGQSGAPGNQRNRGQAQTDDQRIDRLKNRLDRSTPDMRATRQAYVQMIDQRLKERGLPPMTPGRGRARG
ncbi:MAG TPA: hypothetical protein VMJ32_05190 [Pirellulales bacterium]|nr:hypothetical protein [Pirellulales bacterium]